MISDLEKDRDADSRKHGPWTSEGGHDTTLAAVGILEHLELLKQPSQGTGHGIALGLFRFILKLGDGSYIQGEIDTRGEKYKQQYFLPAVSQGNCNFHCK